ncbi:MAG: DUF1801 domain-containing protein [Actinomycetota bacterium]
MEPDVEAWFATTTNPMVDVIRAVRGVVVEHPDISETIKYRAPAFTGDGTIVCYFNWSTKKRASLIFPEGQTIPDVPASLIDGSNRQRMMYFEDRAEVDAQADDLRHVIDLYFASR